jgi:hypothetical protein
VKLALNADCESFFEWLLIWSLTLFCVFEGRGDFRRDEFGQRVAPRDFRVRFYLPVVHPTARHHSLHQRLRRHRPGQSHVKSPNDLKSDLGMKFKTEFSFCCFGVQGKSETGRTAAVVISVLQRIHRQNPHCQALILTLTTEAAQKVKLIFILIGDLEIMNSNDSDWVSDSGDDSEFGFVSGGFVSRDADVP